MDEIVSPEFLSLHRARLDAIGVWQPDPIEPAILWREPASLRGAWVPFDLRFLAELPDEAGSFDPDEEMFALWELYRPRHLAWAEKFRREAEEMFALDIDDIVGQRVVTRACVWVRRAGEPGDIFRMLEVTFSVPADEEHGYFADWNEDTGDFEPLSCA